MRTTEILCFDAFLEHFLVKTRVFASLSLALKKHVFLRIRDGFFEHEFSFCFFLKELARAVISLVRKVSSDL